MARDSDGEGGPHEDTGEKQSGGGGGGGGGTAERAADGGSGGGGGGGGGTEDVREGRDGGGGGGGWGGCSGCGLRDEGLGWIARGGVGIGVVGSRGGVNGGLGRRESWRRASRERRRLVARFSAEISRESMEPGDECIGKGKGTGKGRGGMKRKGSTRNDKVELVKRLCMANGWGEHLKRAV